VGIIYKRKRKDGTTGYRAQVRVMRDGMQVQTSKTFDDAVMAQAWISKKERAIRGEHFSQGDTTLAALIHRYSEEFSGISGWGRSKAADLQRIKTYPLAARDAIGIKSRNYQEHVLWRRKTVAASTAAQDLIWIRQVLKAARSSWGMEIDIGQLDDAVQHLRSTRIIGDSEKRDRRPSAQELARLDEEFSRQDGQDRVSFSMRDIMWFAIHSCRRQDEITKLLWDDLDDRTIMVRDLKDPKARKISKRARLTKAAREIIDRQPRRAPQIFPVKKAAIARRWQRACDRLGIDDLRFHDLRHEGVSRLFEAGYQIQHVQQFSLHSNWATLQRYTQLRPEDVELL